jgi:CheY-like chemotaxis protein
LTIARSIIEQHGGFVWASSKGPGRGAIFDVDLATVAPTGLAGPANATPARRPETHERCRVLLVEDHEDTSELVALSLRQEGYRVQVAASLAEGLAALELEWDAVVSDIGLQDGSGLDIARRVGQLDASRRPACVVALTGYGADADIAASRAAGFDTHLVKPVDLGQLLQVLRDRRDARVV